ncbi:hypothetical protein MAM1_0135d06261 [Mucor ambiguus]|uniref:Zn(2)-C6 fungal-type domain-containing protein n=1 Tax=Mucor ambiguus TaxID=91626 RepID=A0A0C9M8W3_9FUNG|nr:hypothetical protein MAM1_0135d06261 [Mucor ambiguus]
MDSNYYQNQLLSSISEDDTTPYTTLPADGLVYNHLQLTLQVQTDIKNQQRIQDFLNSASHDSILDFDELYSSVATESQLPYLQMMEQQSTTTPFYTPIDSFMDTTEFDMTCLPSHISIAELDAGLDVQQPCHPLSLFPENAAHSHMFPCDYRLQDQDMLNEFNCNNTFDSNHYFDELPSSAVMPPLMPYALPSIHKTAAPISAISNEHHLAYRSNSTPMLSASFSFSSFSSASSNEGEALLQQESILDQDDLSTDIQTPLMPRKSASMSYISEPGTTKRKERMSVAQRKRSMNNIKLEHVSKQNNSKQNNSKQKKVSLSTSSDSLSYYLARQQLSDADEYEEEGDEEPNSTSNISSTTTRVACKKGRNVDKACNHCKRSHLRCDNVRPCRRCVATGKLGCQDVKHKPRGRPRLQKKRNSVPLL